jgi:pilus assembly protein CpaB
MKPKTLILMLVAVGCGLVAAYLASQVGTGASTQPMVPVVVAAVDLSAGAAINQPEKMLMVKNFLLDTAPGGFISNPDDLRNRTLGRNVAKGDPITNRDFSEHGSLFKPAPAGYRAVTIKVTLQSALAGFVLPGSKVDLLCTRADPSRNNVTSTETFMENVLVLAVNTLKAGDKDPGLQTGNVGVVPSVVTLAVKPLDAARIVWAEDKGRISMTLRRPGEEDEIKVPPVTNLQGTDSPGGTGKPQMVRVWVARDNIDPGQIIDKPETFFELEDVLPNMALKAYKDKGTPPPTGKLVHFVAKGMPVLPDHYKPTTAPTGPDGKPAVKPQSGIQVVTVHEPGKDPKHFYFRDGVRIADPNVQKPSDAPAPSKPETPGSEGADR